MKKFLNFITRKFDWLLCHQPFAGMPNLLNSPDFFHNLSLVSKSVPRNILITLSWRCEDFAHEKIYFFKCYLQCIDKIRSGTSNALCLFHLPNMVYWCLRWGFPLTTMAGCWRHPLHQFTFSENCLWSVKFWESYFQSHHNHQHF